MDNLPEERRSASERDDLVHLLHLMVQDEAERERLAAQVETVTGRLVDLTDFRPGGLRQSGSTKAVRWTL